MGEPLLVVENLNAYYGTAHVLHDVSFEMHREPLAIIGRNGMGKSTLCASLVGLSLPRATGSVRVAGEEMLGRRRHEIAAHGVAYVPQGRRLFPSLTVDEHLQVVPRRRPGRWTPSSVLDLFPNLAARLRHRASQLSGGEQQMLAIARALLTNPVLLVMDEPSEGLAPVVIDSVTDAVATLVEDGLAVLVIEQNLGVAVRLAERHLVMVAGQIAAETTGATLDADPDLQRQYLGVEPLAH